MMRKQNIAALVAAILCSLLLAGIVLANGTPAIDWYVIGGGGGHAEGASLALDGTIGQAVVGEAEDTSIEICAGFWCGAEVGHDIYLPLVLRN